MNYYQPVSMKIVILDFFFGNANSHRKNSKLAASTCSMLHYACTFENFSIGNFNAN